jgi:ADP-ribosyl-[dinitrogen reductase] hydrolase
MAISGSCLCGAVRYEIDQLASPIGFCHCRTCQKAHSATFAPTARVNPSHFRWLQGREIIKDFVSSPGKIRQFCGQCGSHIVASKEGQEELIVRVATLDADPNERPAVHIWTSHDVPWLLAKELPVFPKGLPTK